MVTDHESVARFEKLKMAVQCHGQNFEIITILEIKSLFRGFYGH